MQPALEGLFCSLSTVVGYCQKYSPFPLLPPWKGYPSPTPLLWFGHVTFFSRWDTDTGLERAWVVGLALLHFCRHHEKSMSWLAPGPRRVKTDRAAAQLTYNYVRFIVILMYWVWGKICYTVFVAITNFQFPENTILDPLRCKYNIFLWASRSNGIVSFRQMLRFFFSF